MTFATTVLLATTLLLAGACGEKKEITVRPDPQPAPTAPAVTSDSPAMPAKAAHAKLLAVAFHADWCPSCKTIGPIAHATMAEYRDRSIELVVFDLTSDKTTESARAIAHERGLGAIYDQYASRTGRTGFVLLVDAASKQVVATLTQKQSAAQWHATVGEQLGKAGA